MIKFDIITIFPEIFDSYLKEGLLSKAVKNKLVKIKIHDLRKWAKNRHKSVDDRPFGGGFGMVLKVEPIYKAIKSIKAKKPKIILFTPRGKKFNQKMAYQLSKINNIIFICGRYEGVDERVAEKIADMELSIGDYDLMGGELPAMVAIESIIRLIPGVIGKKGFLKERIAKSKGFVEYPQYTRPPKFFVKKFGRARPEVWSVPKVLLSGDHKKIEEWRKSRGKIIE